ncbi:MAG TPA: type VI secretion system membrane subunit TssM [Polyangiaceae bacterium]|jgi:type VI protein secretion system component VasK
MWIWLLAVIVVAGAWIGGTLLEWPRWLEILLTVLAVLMVVTWYMWGRIRGIFKARALERDLIKQAEQQMMNARPDRRGEIMQLQQQMQMGLAAFRARGGGGGAALYRMPWYMIVGPPGAGKTTALRHSGLAFPFVDPRSGGGVRGIGGTRNCDWWFTNDAILLDTAGRYAVEADDFDEWTSFLDTLKKYRSRKPINGVLVAISVTDLMEAREDQIETIAQHLRARIDELAARLHMMVPIYLMLTKVDLVAGFVETWGDMRKSERGQIWGVTFPLAGAQNRDPAKAFEAEFDLLVERMHARAVKRVASERQADQRPRIYQFPIEMANLRQILVDFIGALIQPNNYRETPILRGVYFTSGTQEGRPIDRVIGGMMAAYQLGAPAAASGQEAQGGAGANPQPQMYGAPPPAYAQGAYGGAYGQQPGYAQQPQGAYGQPPQGAYGANPYGGNPGPAYAQQTESKSYFVTDLFRRVVFPDQHIAARTEGETRRQLANRLLFAGAALLVAICLVLPSLYTFARNMSLVSDTRAMAARARHVNWADPTPMVDKVHVLDEAHDEMEILQGWHDRGPPIGLGWGMYSGDELLVGLRATYVDCLQRALVAPTKAQLEHELAPSAWQTRSNIEQYGAYFVRLKTYLAMSEPQRLQHEDGTRETTLLTDAWARAIGVTSTADKAVLKQHVEAYVRLVAQGLAPAWHPDAALVAKVRAVLAQTSRVDRDYSTLVRDANDNVVPITRISIYRGSSFADYVTSRSTPEVEVAGAFTRAGWESYIRDALDEHSAKRLAHDRWVLDEDEQKGVQEITTELDELAKRYFTDYTDAWAAFVRDLEMKHPDSDDAALKELMAEGETPWPLLMLLQTLAENTRLQMPGDSPLAGAVKNRLAKLAGSAESKLQQKVAPAASSAGGVGLTAPNMPTIPGSKRWMSPVELAFNPMVTFGVPNDIATAGGTTGASHYIEKILEALIDVLEEAKSNPRKIDAKLIATAYETAQRATNDLMNTSQSDFTRPLLQPILLDPVTKEAPAKEPPGKEPPGKQPPGKLPPKLPGH